MDILQDIRHQRKMMRQDGRRPARVLVHPEVLGNLLCASDFAVPLAPIDPDVAGFIYGLPVIEDATRFGALVVSDDGPRYGQGKVR